MAPLSVGEGGIKNGVSADCVVALAVIFAGGDCCARRAQNGYHRRSFDQRSTDVKWCYFGKTSIIDITEKIRELVADGTSRWQYASSGGWLFLPVKTPIRN